ncbi:MAG: D-glucuronyl C5-epimerase family protein [Bacteroidota bacterium]
MTSFNNNHLNPSIEFRNIKETDWIKEFYSIDRAVSVNHWLHNKSFTFDTSGIIKANNNYNPVSISQFALACYDHYIKTGDEKYKTHFLNQINYLLDKKIYHDKGDSGIAYPYWMTFHDLNKPPWYSGLAQAEVICVLIRYYALTKDKNVIPIIKKVRDFLFLPLDKGGLLNKTAEGNIWIEEYPNSKQHLHVLNGFFITTIGIIEYCTLFPDDKYAEEIKQECLTSIKKSVQFYETGNNWLTYDRGAKASVSSWYMKAQVLEMEHLFRLTKDTFFRKQSMIWATYTFERPLDMPSCYLNYANLGIPVKRVNNNFVQAEDRSNILTRNIVTNDTAIGFKTRFFGQYLLDNSNKTFFDLTLASATNKGQIKYKLSKNITVGSVIFKLINDTVNINLEQVTYSSDSGKTTKSISQFEKVASTNKVEYWFKSPVDINMLTLQFSNKQKPVAGITEVQLTPITEENELPVYGYFQSEILAVNSNYITVTALLNNKEPYLVCYRSSKDGKNIKQPWNVADSFLCPESKVEINDGDCFVQFMVVFPLNKSKNKLLDVQVDYK